MVSFYLYDIIFLVLFTFAVIIFLYKRKQNLQRQGLLYLYRTKVGIRFIEWTSKKFPKILNALQYLIVLSGYLLMIGMVYLLAKFAYFYLTSPIAAKTLKVPVIVPLVPYLPEIFNLDFLPRLYFTYWIIIIAIIAVPHEFAHGIFARLHNIKIHSTGFGFLGPFLAAFVEPDENEMAKKSKFAQISILASGTFANVVFTILIGIMFLLFFMFNFSPAGVVFNSYASTIIPVSEIKAIDGKTITEISEIKDLVNASSRFTKVEIAGTEDKEASFHIVTSNLLIASDNNLKSVPVIIDSPAFRAELSGTITEIDGKQVKSFDDIRDILNEHSPGEQIKIKAIQENEEIKEYEIELDELNGKAFLGIGILEPPKNGIMGIIYGLIAKIKDPFIYYKSLLGNFGIFIYNLLWWCVLIGISVALVNMLPLGVFDGGRFFMLTVWGITGNKKIGEKAFKWSTWLIMMLIMAMIVKWLFIFV